MPTSSGGQPLSVGVEITGPPHSQPPLPLGLFSVQFAVQRQHVEFLDNEELIIHLFNDDNAGVTPNIVVQYHEWSHPFLFSILPGSHILAIGKARTPSDNKLNGIPQTRKLVAEERSVPTLRVLLSFDAYVGRSYCAEIFVTLTPHPTKSKSAVTAVAVTNANFFFIYSLPTLL